MSLDYNYADVRDEETLHGPYTKIAENTEQQQIDYHKTIRLVFELYLIGVNRITEKNVDKVWSRLDALQKQRGAILSWAGEPTPYTREDIVRRIGYRTNVGDKTDSQFLKTLMEVIRDQDSRG